MMSVLKEAIRATLLERRARLSDVAYQEKSTAIVERMKSLPELQAAAIVHSYWPVIPRHEVDVRPLLYFLHAQKKQIVLPVVVNFGVASDGSERLRHVPFESEDRLVVNRWGIHEPIGTQTVPIEKIDAVIVPALGAGRNGHRIGHGFGYYDEFLRRMTVPTLCPIFDECLVDVVPEEEHDVPVSVIITDKEVYRPDKCVTSAS